MMQNHYPSMMLFMAAAQAPAPEGRPSANATLCIRDGTTFNIIWL